MSHTTESIRNIVLAGHSASGKTTLIESILYHAGKIPAPGAVEKGNTVCDFNPQEKVHQHSLDAALANVATGGAQVLPDREEQDYGRFGWFVDPDGNRVELWQPPDPAKG